MATANAADRAVTIQNFSFQPGSLTIDAGDRVVWTHRDNATHTVTADDGTTFDSGNLEEDDTFTLTFASPGTFPYHCEIHGSMHGTITVRGATTTAVATTTTAAPQVTTTTRPAATTTTAPWTSTTTTTLATTTTSTTIAILAPSTQPTGSSTSSSTSRAPVSGSSSDDDGPSAGLLALIAVLVVGGVGAAAWLTRLWRAGRL